ncbi:MAG TPA: hypothetical protein VEB86_16570 [Chryseosolibacter sp.]|nr:hypothetical protein [Chryseosolibacter sp.]
MKTSKFLRLSFVVVFAVSFLVACESNPDVNSHEDLLPSSFRVDIPSSISYAESNGRISTHGRRKDDTLSGNDMYKHLGTFIAVGKGASQLVEAFIEGIRKHHINRVMTITFQSDDDGRVKNLVVTRDVTFESQNWDYSLTITDADSEAEADGGKALQLFWNKDANVTGIAIIKPYNCDRTENANAPDAVFRIDYTEGGTDYDQQMEVTISGLPLGNPATDPFAMSTLKMFAGKNGDVIDVYGNSNHPNATLFGSGSTGFNWAFVASSNRNENIGVAEVGLPPSALDSDDREVLLKEYSIKNVFTAEITAAWPNIDQEKLDAYLSNIKAPGYFNHGGFVSGGTSPGAAWEALATRLNDLSPYNPKDVSNLEIIFQ